MSTRTTKTYWSYVGAPLRPTLNWRLGRAARWFETALDLPPGTVCFIRPNGRPATANKKVRALRSEWQRHRARC